VVADDEPAIAVFDLAREPLEGELLPLDETELPADHAERKAAKPDLESLCLLPDGSLFTLGSGATDRRERGWLMSLDTRERHEVSLHELYAALRKELADLNIEGAAVADERLWLAQRGNGRDGENALIELDLEEALAGLRERRAVDPAAVRGVGRHDLGEEAGVALTFSDLCPLPDGRLLFSAVAEAGESTYLDGECVAAAVGLFEEGAVRMLEPLAEPHKIEGVSVADAVPGRLDLVLVADGDDPAEPAPLLAASVAL
jgi:uncharacterized protein DUF6910